MPENLEAAMHRARLNQSQLADRAGMTQPSIARLLNGKTKTTRALDLIAAALGTSSAYLKGEADDPGTDVVASERQAFAAAPSDRADVVELYEYNLAYGMDSAAARAAPRKQRQAFSRTWLRNFTDSPFEALFFARGIGDSMMPTVLDSDNILIDTAQRTPRLWDQLWAVEKGGLGMIKRLRPGRDGAVRLLSDNPGIPEDLAENGEITVLGRVIAVVRKI